MPLSNSWIGKMPLQKQKFEICHSIFFVPLHMPLFSLPNYTRKYTFVHTTYTHVQDTKKKITRVVIWWATRLDLEPHPQTPTSRDSLSLPKNPSCGAGRRERPAGQRRPERRRRPWRQAGRAAAAKRLRALVAGRERRGCRRSWTGTPRLEAGLPEAMAITESTYQ